MSTVFNAIVQGALWGTVALTGVITLLFLWTGVRFLRLERRLPTSSAQARSGRDVSRRFAGVVLFLALGLGLLTGSLIARLLTAPLAGVAFWEIVGVVVTAIGVWLFGQTRRQASMMLKEWNEET
jgi:hypothetical protein